jgi:hypothetical protein
LWCRCCCCCLWISLTLRREGSAWDGWVLPRRRLHPGHGPLRQDGSADLLLALHQAQVPGHARGCGRLSASQLVGAWHFISFLFSLFLSVVILLLLSHVLDIDYTTWHVLHNGGCLLLGSLCWY